MRGRTILCGISIFAVALGALAAPAAASTVPAIRAFDRAFAKVNDYTVTVSAHERLGNQSQFRVYHYWFKRPNLAKTLIIKGDGAGSGGVWNGGDQVSGHQGGFLAFIHLKVGLHDSRATSLRGYTIPEGLLQNEVDKYTKIPGKLTQSAGPVIDGQPTEMVQLEVANPDANQHVSRMVIYLSKTTYFPLRQIRYHGNRWVADDSFTDLKTNVGLKTSDFPF